MTASLAPGVTLLRPLLAFSKARLIATCAARGWASRHDPSNDDPRFARTRLRRLMPALAVEGLTAEAIARAAARLGRAEAALDHATAEIGRHALRTAGPGVRQLDLGPLAALPPDFTIRLLGEAVGAAGPDGPRIRLDRLEQAGEALRAAAAAGAPLRRTLGGCLLRLDAAGLLTIGREGPRRRGAGPSGEARGAASPVKPNGGASLGKGPLDPYIAR